MRHNTLWHYMLVRGALQFGLIAAGLFLGLMVFWAWPDGTVRSDPLYLAICAPFFGAGLGFTMYLLDRWRGKL